MNIALKDTASFIAALGCGLPDADGYITPVTQAGSHFVAGFDPDATPRTFEEYKLRPTAVLYGAGGALNFWALETPVSESEPDLLAVAEAFGMAGAHEPLPTPGVNDWSLEYVDEAARYSLETLSAAYLGLLSGEQTEGLEGEAGGVSEANTVGLFGIATIETPFDPNDYQREITITLGRNRESKHWVPAPQPELEFLSRCSTHPEGPKDGLGFVFGDMFAGQRLKKSVKKLYGVGLDIDTGTPTSVVNAAMRSLGCVGVRYTTHSNGKTKSEVDVDKVSKLTGGQPVSMEVLRQYLREHEHWDDTVVASVSSFKKEHTRKGFVYELHHAEMPKHRLVFLFEVPFDFAHEAEFSGHATAMKKWEKVPEALARHLGLPFDKSCTDPSRIFFFPRHNKGQPYSASVFGGKRLDWRKLNLEDPMDRLNNALNSGSSRSKTDGGRELGGWWKQYGHGFQAADFVEAYAPDRVRHNTGHGLEVKCPFDEYHTNSGDPEDRACFVVNATEGQSDSFVFSCQHQSCKDKTKLDMLAKLVADEEIPHEVLTAQEFNAIIDDDAANTTREGSSEGKAGGEYPLPMFKGKLIHVKRGGRAWIARLKKVGDERVEEPLCTAFSIEGSLISVDRDSARSIRLKAQTEEGEAAIIDIPAAESVKAGGKDLLAKMREQGVLMTEAGMKFIVELIRETQPPNAIHQYGKPGFRARVFIAPSGDAINSNYPVELTADVRQKGNAYSGNLEGWREAVRHAFPHFHFSLAAITTFVGSLVDLLGWETVVIYLSGETSHGKTTSQKISASGWGNVTASQGQLISAKATENALELDFAKASGSYLAIDEGAFLDGEQTKKVIFMGHGGSGKSRMSQHGNAKPTRAWRTCITVSDEIGLVQKLHRDNQVVAGGLTVRAVDVNYDDAEKLSPDVMAKLEEAFENTGHAGPAFVRQLIALGYVDDPSRLIGEIRDIAADLVGANGSPQQLRAARIPALVKKAGLIAQSAGLLPEDADIDAIARELWKRTGSSDLAPVSNSVRALEALRESIITRKGVDILEVGSDTYRQAKGWHLPDEAAYAILVSAAPDLAGGIMTNKALGKALKAANWLVPHQGKGNAREYVTGIGRVPCYVIRATEIDG